jgi:hypothetical protein
VADETRIRDAAAADSPKRAVAMVEGDVDFEFEPCDGIEFQSHEESYSFYQEYAKSTAFATSIKNSRWSQKS